MGMNNVWYPYVEMADDEELKTLRPELRMNAYATHGGVSRAKFEAFALAASIVFSCAMWVTDHRVKTVVGALRSFSTMSLVTLMLGTTCAVALAGGLGAGAQGFVGTSLHWPADTLGWVGLAGLTILYGTAFSTLFVLMPRLDMARNAPASNIEPVAAIIMGWLLLGQTLNGLQIVGALLVIAGIVLLATARRG